MSPTLLSAIDEALLLHSRVLKLEAPANRTLKAFKEWFGSPGAGNTRLRGGSSHILDDDDDLVALRVPAEQDRLTKLVQAYFPLPFVVSQVSAISDDVLHHRSLTDIFIDRNRSWTHSIYLGAAPRALCGRLEHHTSGDTAPWSDCASLQRAKSELADGDNSNLHDAICGQRGASDQCPKGGDICGNRWVRCSLGGVCERKFCWKCIAKVRSEWTSSIASCQ